MKRFLALLLFSTFLLFSLSPSLSAQAQSVWSENKKVTANGKTWNVQVVWTNLNDPTIRLETVVAKNQVGQVNSLKNIVDSTKTAEIQPLAGINGTFFNAYDATYQQPMGTILSKGKFLHLSTTGTTLGFDHNGKFTTSPLYVTIQGGINDQWEWPNNWYAWNVNHYYTDPTAISIFTPDYGTKTPPNNVTSVVVDKGVIVNIGAGQQTIPSDGYVIVTGNPTMLEKFKTGDTLMYQYKTFVNTFNPSTSTQKLDWSHIRTGLSAGPLLVKNGVPALNAKAEGFSEPKIISASAQRSFIGVTKNNQLAMGTVAGANMEDLTQIALQMGLIEAINLDGGASSGLYYKGSYLHTPGREISNALVVTKLQERPIKVLLNNQPIFFDVDPFIKKPENITLVPLRQIAEALGAVISYDAGTQQIRLDRGKDILYLKANSNQMTINGKTKQMATSIVSKNGRTMVPVRFVTEVFGGEVTWHEDTKTVGLKIGIVNIEELYAQALKLETSGNLEGAITKYLAILDANDQHLPSLRKLAEIYSKKQDHANTIYYYEKFLNIDKDDTGIWGSLGWSKLALQDFTGAAQAFLKQVELNPDSFQGYYGLGAVYSYYGNEDIAKAKSYFQKALEKGATGAQKNHAENYIQTK